MSSSPSGSAPASLLRLWRRVLAQLDGLSALAAQPELHAIRVERVSKWSVGEQLTHLYLSCRGVANGLDGLESGELKPRRPRMSWSGRLILWSGFIPRGMGRSPAGVRPEQEMVAAELEAGFGDLRRRYEAIEPRLAKLAASGWALPHPLLGDFTSQQWLRFVEVHNHHHLKIIRDIRRAAD